MGNIATSERQLTVFYASESTRVKQTLAYAKAEGFSVLEIDISKTPITGTQILELAGKLGVPVKELINQEHKAYTEKFDAAELSSNDWIKMIQHNPEILRQPIVLWGDKTRLIETPSDVLKM